MSEPFDTEREISTEPPTSVRLGVLSFHNSKETKAILNAVRALGHEPVWLREENTQTWISEGELHFDPVVDVVANRLLATKATQPADDLGMLTSYGAALPVLNEPSTVMRTMHKYSAAAALAASGLPVPDAYMAFAHQTMNGPDTPVDGPTVHKPVIGTNGCDISLVDADDAVSPHIARRRAFLQQFLDPDDDEPFDVRVYVVGGQVVAAMKRYAPDDEWRTNVSLGGAVEGMTENLPGTAATLARRATEVLDLDYAGVDLLYHDGEWYVLEVNATAGFKGLYEATGISPAPYIARLAIERAGGVVDAEKVAELATTLDDSVPDCKPSLKSTPEKSVTVGYTERVAVSGGPQITHAIAKSDTGAKRTSIDIDLAAEIGVGPIVDTASIKSGVANGRQKRPLVDIDVRVGSRWHTTTASIEDRSHMTYPVLLGRDVLRGYKIDIEQRVTEE